MFENMQQTFNGLFGKVAPGMCRLTMNGGIAVKWAKKQIRSGLQIMRDRKAHAKPANATPSPML